MHTPVTTQTILIVDDQDQNIQIVSTLLSAMGYEIVAANSGAQALQRLAAQRPDLILLDVVMPGKDGLQVCREILAKPEWKGIPIIFLSAVAGKDLIVEALEAGAVDYVTKPFNKAELLSRVRTHLALKETRDRLRELAADKDELLGILANDLNNHLADMRLCVGLLAERSDEPSTERSADLAATILQSTDRMLAFVKEFVANQSAERLQVSPRSLSLGDEVRAALERHREAARAKGIELAEDITASPAVLADPEALAQILDNLVGNAVKFSPSPSTVTVEIPHPALTFASVVVADEGPGFTDEDRGRLFRRYGRLSARPTGGEPSTGLGLSIVKRLVEAMKGRVELEERADDEAPCGARIRIRLPLAESN